MRERSPKASLHESVLKQSDKIMESYRKWIIWTGLITLMYSILLILEVVPILIKEGIKDSTEDSFILVPCLHMLTVGVLCALGICSFIYGRKSTLKNSHICYRMAMNGYSGTVVIQLIAAILVIVKEEYEHTVWSGVLMMVIIYSAMIMGIYPYYSYYNYAKNPNILPFSPLNAIKTCEIYAVYAAWIKYIATIILFYTVYEIVLIVQEFWDIFVLGHPYYSAFWVYFISFEIVNVFVTSITGFIAFSYAGNRDLNKVKWIIKIGIICDAFCSVSVINSYIYYGTKSIYWALCIPKGIMILLIIQVGVYPVLAYFRLSKSSLTQTLHVV